MTVRQGAHIGICHPQHIFHLGDRRPSTCQRAPSSWGVALQLLRSALAPSHKVPFHTGLHNKAAWLSGNMSVHRAGLTVWILVVVQAKSATRQDGTEAWGGNPNRNLVAWDGVHDTVVHTHAPVLRWASRVDCGGLFTFRVLVNLASNGSAVWDSGEVFQQRVPSFPGIAVVEGPALRAGLAYAWSVHERQVANASGADARRMGTWLAGSGTFNTAPAPQFPTPQAELVAELTSENISALWNGSWHSVVDRIRPSGFLPTSVSGGCELVA